MIPRFRYFVSSLSVVLLVIAGCGTDEEKEAQREKLEQAIEELEADLEKSEEEQAQGQECADQLQPLIDSLSELDGRLAVGLSYAAYSRGVQDVSIAYNAIDFKSVEIDCLSAAGIPSEQAFRRYAKAEETWGNCIEDFGCDLDGIDPQLQTAWTVAGTSLEQARNGLRRLTEKVEQEVEKLEGAVESAEEGLQELNAS